MVDDLYPAGPAGVPRELTKPTRAFKRHAWLALAGLFAFVALYVFLCFWFIRTAYRNIAGALAGGENAFLGMAVGAVAAVIALFLVKALFSVTRGGKVTDIEITAETEPELFRFLYRLADETGAPRPHRVFFSPHVNAAVFYDLSFLNLIFPSKKNLEIGLGLVNALTLSELKAVLAHEFGHFAQRSMAVSRWVYMAAQIAGHIVARRDWFDRGLAFLSAIDLRVAWLGWLLRLIVWSIRSILDTAFSLVVLAQRALSREMEFQADLVAVSVSGSDALIHALHRLNAADQAWDRALHIAATEHGKGLRVPDLFAIQTRVTEHMRVILDDEHHAAPPQLPEENRAEHRIFSEQLAQAPRMWSTHPSNREREENAKRIYVDAPLDERSAWSLLRDAEKLRESVTEHVLSKIPAEEKLTNASAEEAVAAVDKRFSSLSLDRRYRGAYLGRSAVLHTARAQDLHGPAPDASTLVSGLKTLYPAALADQLTAWRRLSEEVDSLEALRDGILSAPGGVIRHRGRTLKRKELPGVIGAVKEERDKAGAEVEAHDRRCRTLHLEAARTLGRGWPEYLQSLAALLHYAGHAEADVDDAKGHLVNVFSVVVADGRVSNDERIRLVRAASELHGALWEVDQQRGKVELPETVAKHLGIEAWSEALPKKFEFHAPSAENIGDWMQVFESWHAAFSNALCALAGATLDTLLEAETHVSQAFCEGRDPGAAPEPASIPSRYTTRVTGTERDRQRRLGWWDRFITADGVGPALGRFAAAAAIIGSVLGFGGAMGDATIVVYNGLTEDVTVQIGSTSLQVSPASTAQLKVPPTDRLPITAKSPRGTLIESFNANADNGLMTYVYNVASATPLVEWTAVYGYLPQTPPHKLGALRFQPTTANVLFTAPPTSVSTKGGGAQRTVLTGFGEATPAAMLDETPAKLDQNTIVEAHARWDRADSLHILEWLSLAAELPSFPALIKQRLQQSPHEVAALRTEQDAAKGDHKAKLCARHRELAAASPANIDLKYIALRCIEDKAQRERALQEAYAANPENPWLANAAGHDFSEQGAWDKAVPALVTASRLLPLQERAALKIQRIVRVALEVSHPSTSELMRSSRPLTQLLQLETGDGVPEGPYRSFSLLGRGELAEAVERASQEPLVQRRVLRLAAASDGAPRDLVEQALVLSNDQDLDQITLWASIALHVREQRQFLSLAQFARTTFGEHTEPLLKLAENRAMFDDSKALAELLPTLPLELQAQVYVMGSVIRGDAAPAVWRQRANGLLFASERPYFRTAVTAKTH